MSADLVIAGGEVVSATGTLTADVLVCDGAISGIVAPGTGRAEHHLDARGRWVLPGMVDIHVHLRDPGFPHKETFSSGTAAAAHGGITTVADMPNTKPALVTEADLTAQLQRAGSTAMVDFTLWAAATRPEEFPAFAAHGIAGVKVFLAGRDQGAQYDDEISVGDDGHLLEILRAAAASDLLVAVHLANPEIERVWRRGWRGRPFAEVRQEIVAESRLDKIESASRTLLLAEHAGARVHLVHVSAAVLPMVGAARARGVRVTAESFAPFISTADVDRLGVMGYDRYRRPDEIAALWAAMDDGGIDNLASDHAPHTWAEKVAGERDVLSGSSGYPELDTILPMMLDRVLAGHLELHRLVALYAAAPARIAGLADRKGSIAVGHDADLVLVDPAGTWTIDAAECRSTAGWTPFQGRRLRGRIERVLLRGRDASETAPRGVFQPRSARGSTPASVSRRKDTAS